jgi:chromosome segregation ATPase
MKCLKIVLILLGLAFTMQVDNKANFSESTFMLNGDNELKGQVSLDSRGIVITSSEAMQDTNDLKLVSVEKTTESHLIDFRLFRTCNIEAMLLNGALRLNFSPMSVENRSKNDNFDIQVDILNYRNVIPKEYETVEQIGGYLKSLCEARKKVIAQLKDELESAISKFKSSYASISELSKQVHSQTAEVENVKSAIQDAENQIKGISNLKKSYQTELNSIEALTSGASRLITKESTRSKEIQDELEKLKADIKGAQTNAKVKSETISQLKESNRKVIEKSKDVENVIIGLQRDLSEMDGIIAGGKSTKLGLGYDLKAARTHSEELDKSLGGLVTEIQLLDAKSKQNYKRSETANKSKTELESLIQHEKDDIKKIEDQINKLILEKSTKEEILKSSYDKLKAKDEELVNVRLETEQVNSNIKRLSSNRERIQNTEKVELKSKIDKLTSDIDLMNKKEVAFVEKENKLKATLSDNIKTKANLEQMLSRNNKDIEKLGKEISTISNNRINLEKRISDLTESLNVENKKVNNLRTEAKNYDLERNTIKKSLTIADQNLETFKSIVNEFNAKLNPTQNGYNEIVNKKNTLESEINSYKEKIKTLTQQFRKETPSAVIMLDMAEDQALNEETSNTKWKEIIDKIIN